MTKSWGGTGALGKRVPAPKPKARKATAAESAMYGTGSGQQGSGRNNLYSGTYNAAWLDEANAAGYSKDPKTGKSVANMPYGAVRKYYTSGANAGVAPTPTPTVPGGGSGGGGGGGRGYGGGGGGGGGGAAAATAAAQAQIDSLMKLLGSSAYKTNPATYDAMRATVNDATARDQASATGAFNNLDTWLGANASNPFANVQLQQAQRAPDQNPYLASQGVAGTNYQTSNQEDVGAYGAFQNVLSLLGANQLAGNTSRQAESQMARAFTGNQIGAVDNAYLGQIANQQAQAQQALDTEKRQAVMQLMQLLGTPGTTAPDLAALGYV